MNGEANSFTDLTYGFGENAWKNSIEMVFHNYDVSFHNELWSGAFSGNFATGMTWLWERLFWWPKCLPTAPRDEDNLFQTDFYNELGATNVLQPVLGVGVPVTNRPLLHQIKPLADMFTNENLLATGFFDNSYTPRRVHDNANGIGCYYMMNDYGTMAIGWVHNLDAWMMNSHYLASPDGKQNLLGCNDPDIQSITLPGFAQAHDFYITYFPTRTNASVPPNDTVVSGLDFTIMMDLSALPLGGVAGNYLDTLHSDYAFIVAPYPVPRRMLFEAQPGPLTVSATWDFSLHPNPANGICHLAFQDDTVKSIEIYDLAGRRMHALSGMLGTLVTLSTGSLTPGAYQIRVTSGAQCRTKQLIIHR